MTKPKSTLTTVAHYFLGFIFLLLLAGGGVYGYGKYDPEWWIDNVAEPVYRFHLSRIEMKMRERNPRFELDFRRNIWFTGHILHTKSLHSPRFGVPYLSLIRPMPIKYLDLEFSRILDLSPLNGLPLKTLVIDNTKVVDISTLKGMPLSYFHLSCTKVIDLSPLKRMQLKELFMEGTQVADLSPLKGMPLEVLDISETKVADLSPLKGMPLEGLSIRGTKVTDLSPLKGMPLTWLNIEQTNITDLSPLKGMPLEVLVTDNKKIDLSHIDQSKTEVMEEDW